MKKSICFIIILSLIIILFIPYIYAEETEDIEETDTITEETNDDQENGNELGIRPDFTDLTSATISYEMASNSIKVVIKGAEVVESNILTLYVSNSREELEQLRDFEISYVDNSSTFLKREDGNYEALISNSIGALNQDIYYIIRDKNGDSLIFLTDVKKIERPSLPKYGTRLDIYFVNPNYLSVHQSLYYHPLYNRKISYKIGKITDNNILKKFKTDEDQAFNELFTYAKNDKGIYSSQALVNSGEERNPTPSLNLQSDAYYYCYMVMDDENGKYVPIDDVAIYQAMDDGTMVHFSFASMRIDEKITDNPSNPSNKADPTIAKEPYPKTGAVVLGTIAILLLGSSVLFFIKNRNLKDVK